MTPISHPTPGQIYSILLAPFTAHVVVQVQDRFLETFLPRSQAEKLRVGNKVLALPSENGMEIRLA